MAVFGNGNLKPWADGHCLFTRWPGNKWHLPLQNGQGLHTEIKTRTNHTIRKETSTGNGNSMKKDASGNVPHLVFLSVIWKIKLQGDITTEKSKRPLSISSDSVKSIQFMSFIMPIFAWNAPLISLIFLRRYLIFHSIVFLYFFALITEKGFLISPCYSLEICVQMGIPFLFSFAFHFSSFLSYLEGLFQQPFCFVAFLFLGDGLDHCLLYNVTNLHL